MKPTTWEFQEELIFKRYDSFTDRLVTVREFFRTAEQFLKLEKVECGGKLIWNGSHFSEIRGLCLMKRFKICHIILYI